MPAEERREKMQLVQEDVLGALLLLPLDVWLMSGDEGLVPVD